LNQSVSDDAFVFSQPDGSPLLPDSVSHAFTRIAGKAGINGVRFHDLRHTHATPMLQQGVHPKIVSERLGHGSIAITLDTYSHVIPGLEKAAGERFDEGLGLQNVCRMPFQGSSGVDIAANEPVAQGQSSGLLIRVSWVRFPPGSRWPSSFA